MTEADAFAQYQEQERIRQEEEQRRIEEERRRRDEQRRQMAAQQQGPAGGIAPGAAMQMYSNFSGGSPVVGGISTTGSEGAGAGTAGGASSASSGFSMWPLAVAATVIAHNQWAKKKGLHDNLDAIDGRALYKDSEYYQEKGNEKVGGMGDEVRLAAMGSSPADLLRKDTWVTAAKLAAHGGILGNALKKIF